MPYYVRKSSGPNISFENLPGGTEIHELYFSNWASDFIKPLRIIHVKGIEVLKR